MSWINTPQMLLLERYLDVISMRQTLVSTNVANLDTPGYARQRPVRSIGDKKLMVQRDCHLIRLRNSQDAAVLEA